MSTELSNTHMLIAVAGYAHGKTTSQIIDEMLEELALESTPENREKIRFQLRSANPTDKQFSTTKYGVIYELARESAIDAFREKAREFADRMLSSYTESFESISDIELQLNDLLEKASDASITSNTEFLNTVRTLMALQKVKIETVNAFTELIDKVTQSIPVSSASTQDD